MKATSDNLDDLVFRSSGQALPHYSVMGHESRPRPLASLPSEQMRRKKKHCAQQREECVYRDADQPQRDRYKPDNGKKNQRQYRHRPAKHKQNAPAHKKQQSFHPSILSFLWPLSRAKQRRDRRDSQTFIGLREYQAGAGKPRCPSVRRREYWHSGPIQS